MKNEFNEIADPQPPPTHTHCLESTETINSTLECKQMDQIFKIFHVKNVNKRKNRLTPVKLESKKQHKKVLASREGSNGKCPSTDRKKPRPRLCFHNYCKVNTAELLVPENKDFEVAS